MTTHRAEAEKLVAEWIRDHCTIMSDEGDISASWKAPERLTEMITALLDKLS